LRTHQRGLTAPALALPKGKWTMATDLRRLETIIIVIMENRSFDHLLGYLSLAGGRTDVDGVKDEAWRLAHANPGTAGPVSPFALTQMGILDPPHEREPIAWQIGTASGSPGPMMGFVQSYARRRPAPDDESLVMGFYRAPHVPMADFFAREFLICDHWFSSLPTGTQPNRLMAMSGIAAREDNAQFLLTDQELVYDWLDRHAVPWRVYHDGPLPFFALMERWQPEIAKDLAVDLLGIHTKFRRYEHFDRDFRRDPTLPPVIFVEPEFTDGPHVSPNDDHPPTSIADGQKFLYSIYQTLMRRPDRWSKTLLMVTYDEHGGFFDHVSPQPIRTDPPPGCAYEHGPFETTGVRVPAFLVSPFVERGRTFPELLDHTSLLGLLADRFTPGQPYSDAVARRSPPLSRLAAALTRDEPRTDLPAAPPGAQVTPPQVPRAAIPPRPETQTPGAANNTQAFQAAARTMVQEHPLAAAQLLPELGHFVAPEAP
jgi:phospholipase C